MAARSRVALRGQPTDGSTPDGFFGLRRSGDVLAVVVCASGTARPGESRIVYSLQRIFEQASPTHFRFGTRRDSGAGCWGNFW